jgi:protein phosphatase
VESTPEARNGRCYNSCKVRPKAERDHLLEHYKSQAFPRSTPEVLQFDPKQHISFVRGEVLQVRNQVSFGHGSSVGMVRETNEDYHRVKLFQTAKGQLSFLAVADGMGGAAAGEHASKLAIDTVTKAIEQYVEFINSGRGAIPLEKALEKSILAANKQIYKMSMDHLERSGMGTTLTVAIVYGTQLLLGHVGDSRGHLIRKNMIKQITKDHSWVQAQVDSGTMTLEAAENHQYRNLLLQALGTKPNVTPEIKIMQVMSGDMIVLCSDGLHGLVKEEEIRAELARSSNLQSAIDYWIGLAESRGAPDNVTVVVARIGS